LRKKNCPGVGAKAGWGGPVFFCLLIITEQASFENQNGKMNNSFGGRPWAITNGTPIVAMAYIISFNRGSGGILRGSANSLC